MRPSGLRRRLFRTLFLAALVPAGITLALGALAFREVVTTTGSAGPWVAVAESGRRLLDLIGPDPASPELAEAAARHREVLSESVRLSRVYSVLGERIVLLTPVAALFLLALVAAVAAGATRRLAASFAAPAEELAAWIRALGDGRPLPPPSDEPARDDVREFQALRSGLREAEGRLEEARRREVEQARTRSWADMARRAAHEIKNPLTPMRMAAQKVADSPDAGSAEAGRVLLEEIGHLDQLARSFSRYARPVEGPPAPVDLNELLAGLARRWEAEGAPVAVELPPEPVVVHGHLDALERVVRNLVSNALDAVEGEIGDVRAADPGAAAGDAETESRAEAADADGGREPAVRVRLRGRRAHAILTVEDRGPGIPTEILDRIWEPDFTTRRRGTGLGLPLVRRAVESHGGEVAAANRAEGGARFEVRLPVEPRDPDKRRDQLEPRNSSGPREPVAPLDPVQPRDPDDPEPEGRP